MSMVTRSECPMSLALKENIWGYLAQRLQNFLCISLLMSTSCRSTFQCTEISVGEQMNLPSPDLTVIVLWIVLMSPLLLRVQWLFMW